MADNQIVIENARTDGVMPQSYWDVEHTTQIEGFATDISTNIGNTVDFKINVNGNAGSDYIVEIFRLGYYGGEGARKVAEWINTDATVQPEANYDATLGLVDAGNWSVTDSWDVPEDAVSGVYLARIQRLDANGDPIGDAVNQIPFIIRDDDREADIVLQTSDTTWHAYNGWFGNNGQIGANFYGDYSGEIDHPDIEGGQSGFLADRAYAVSYNRPFITRGVEGEQGGPAAGAHDYLFGADYAAIYWLEQNGYDVSYISGVDTDRLGADYLTKYEAFISVGHDEYWSGEQRENVEAARDAGVNLLFWGGNDIYWKTRWESCVIDGVEYRTLVCYKETWANLDPNAGPDDYNNLDPTDIWTGTWRDTRFEGNPLAGYAMPDDLISGQPHICNCAENALTGQLFGPDGTLEFGGALDVPEEFAPLRVWRDTSIADGGALNLSPGLIGYEWNTSPDNEQRPAGLIHLSETRLSWTGILVDQGNLTQPGSAVHNLSLYRAESGALVFGAGTVFWTWALSDMHDSSPYGASIENTDLKQFVVNMFADMGIQPGVADAVLASQGLIRALASNDFVAATATIDDLPDAVSELGLVTITGTASDDDGDPTTVDGVVALVEISFDGGATWKVAEGTTNWSYTWLPTTQQIHDIRVRAIDDSLNMPNVATLDQEIVDVTERVDPDEVSLFIPWTTLEGQYYHQNTPHQLGTRFTASQAGQVTELHYWRDSLDAGDTDIRIGRLWRADGTLLATVEFVSAEGEAGWQTAILSSAVTLFAGQEYIVAYETQDNYVAAANYFTTGYSDPFGILLAPGSSGVFAQGSGNILPTESYRATNYWVDVTFVLSGEAGGKPSITSPSEIAVDENNLLAAMITALDPEGDAIRYGIAGGADAGLFSINAATGALVFNDAPDYEAPADADGDNVYEITVSATDGLSGVATRSIEITIADVETETPLSSLFGPGQAPALVETNDPADYELGTRFEAEQSGQVVALRYWRGAADASDTDVRTLNLWTAGGVLLASATANSAPGDDGWQTVLLDNPVILQGGQGYVVSYGTVQNYAVTQNYFSAGQSGPGGMLSAPASAGVFAGGQQGIFPTETYQASNYWVDVVFEAIEIENDPPAFTLAGASFSAQENQNLVTTLTATDPDGDEFVFAISGGEDAALFQLNATNGVLRFRQAPDYENPADNNGDNLYELQVSVSDGIRPAVTQAITVAVTDQTDEASRSTLFSAADAPAQIITTDSDDYELGVEFMSNAPGEVVSLRYWRGAADATDTDTRTLNLWDGGGNLLASVTVQSDPGEDGWQTGVLDTAVTINANEIYVASYGTTQNYAFSRNFYDTDWTGADGVLTAPSRSGGNGVFHAGGTGIFPTASFNASNYWVDVTLETSFEV